MGLFLYNIGIWIYWSAIRFSSIFNTKASDFVNGRKGVLSSIKDQISKQDLIWFHCASLGEFEQGRPIIEEMREKYPQYKILLTFYSPSAYNIRKHYEGADYVTYLPIDSRKNASKFVEIVNPVIAVFVKYEFWHHYFEQLKNRQIPLVIISSIFRKDQIFFKKYGHFYREILSRATKIFTQDKNSIQLLTDIRVTDSEQAGDTRFDRVWQIKAEAKEVEYMSVFKGNANILVVGSCWKEDLEVLIPFINNSPSKLKFIIAPHEISNKNLQFLTKEIKLDCIKYSECQSRNPGQADVMIIDNVGLLSKLYNYGEYAFVGGAFGDGLHNILEPAAFGLPVFFGNRNFTKFKEARDLIEIGGAFSVSDYFDFSQKFIPLADPRQRSLVSDIVRSYVKSNTGATSIIMRYLSTILNGRNSN